LFKLNFDNEKLVLKLLIDENQKIAEVQIVRNSTKLNEQDLKKVSNDIIKENNFYCIYKNIFIDSLPYPRPIVISLSKKFVKF
jgi:hypothetical protein